MGKKLIEDLNFIFGLGALIQLDSYWSCIANLVQFEVFPELDGDRGILFSKKIDPNGCIYKDIIGHGDSFPMCLQAEVYPHAPGSSLSFSSVYTPGGQQL
jgi:hypothetical protein